MEPVRSQNLKLIIIDQWSWKMANGEGLWEGRTEESESQSDSLQNWMEPVERLA